MAIRRRTGDPFYRSSYLLPRPAVSIGDQGELDSLLEDRSQRSVFNRGMGRSPITAPKYQSRVRAFPVARNPFFLPSRLSGSIGGSWRRALSGDVRDRRSRRTSQTKLSGLSIRVPSRVKFCLQRKQRREVLFALRRAGFGGSAPKRSYRRTQNSQYRC